jgi:hypothetical protein
LFFFLSRTAFSLLGSAANRGHTRQAESPSYCLLIKLCDDVGEQNLMQEFIKKFVLALVLFLAVAYGYDYASVRRRMTAKKPGDPFDVVTYPHLLAIPEKGNKVEYALDAQAPMASDPCVHSLFPHFGYTPCWIVQKRAKTPTPMMILWRRL